MAAIPSDLLDDLDDLGSDDDDGGGVAPHASHAAASAVVTGGAAAGLAGTKRRHGAGGAGGAGAGDGSDGDSDDGDGSDDSGDSGSDDDGDGAAAAAAAAARADAAARRDVELDAQLAALGGRRGYRAVARLAETPKFLAHVAAIDAALAAGAPPAVVGTLEEWPEYRLIVSSNAVIAAIDDEAAALFRYIADAYAAKFPELEAMVPAPAEYVRTVRLIGNEADLTLVDLPSLLPPATVMMVTVTGSATAGKPLPPDALADVLAACDAVVALEAVRSRILAFIESRMSTVAPNTSALVGTRIAAQLVALAGGLGALSNMPACNVQVMGARKKALAGFSRVAATPHVGVLLECDIVAGTPPDYRRYAARQVAAKVVLAARLDSFGDTAAGGRRGAALRAAVVAKIAKKQEPPPGKQKKPLPAPDDKPSRRRGGRRFRKLKEKMGMTDVRKEANRMSFASTAAEYGDSVMGLDRGMLEEAGTGKLRVQRKEQRILKKRKLQGVYAGSSGATGGFASSLVFTHTQGIELVNPALLPAAGGAGASGRPLASFATAAAAVGVRPAGAAPDYLSATGTFRVVPR